MSKHQEEFIKAIRNSGLIPPAEIVADGKIHRFRSEGGSKNRNGWYVLHLAPKTIGIYGCFKAIQEPLIWIPGRSSEKLKPSELKAYKAELKKMREQCLVEKALDQKEAAKMAEMEWGNAEDPNASTEWWENRR